MKFLPLFFLLTIPCLFFAYSLKASVTEANVVSVFVITNIKQKGHFGDRSQSRGIKQALIRMLKKQGYNVDVEEVDVHELDGLKAKTKELSNRSIVISSGDYGIRALHVLKEGEEISSKVMTIWSGHQEFKGLRDMMSSLNVVVIPQYLISKSLKISAWSVGTELIGVEFIPHNLNLNKLKFAYDNFEFKNKIPIDRAYTVLLLGGDAPDIDGNILHIKDKEMHGMASKVAKIVRENRSTLVITNSYRTKESQVALFIDNIKALGIKEYVFFDFHKGIRAYKALLYLISRGNTSIVTGDSISMIDEAVQFSKKPVYIEKVSSMNENHTKHLDFIKDSKDAMLLSEYDEGNLDYKTPPFASKVIVKELLHNILTFLEKNN